MPEFLTSDQIYERLEKELRDRVGDGTKMQCRICWYIYDPEAGCEENQTPPHTPFKSLPNWWTCPECGNGKDVFFPYDDPDAESQAK